jgi:hypothetical protein
MVKVYPSVKKGSEIESQAREVLQETVKRIPGVLAEFAEIDLNPEHWTGREKGLLSDPGYDLRLLLRGKGEEWEIRAEVKSVGHPKQAREAAFWLKRSLEKVPAGRRVYPVFIAPYLSAEAMAICEEEGIGCLDLSGNGRLAFGDVFIEKQGRSNQFKTERTLKSLYSPKAERVLRVMLSHPIRPWKVQNLADECRVSLGQVSKVGKHLMEREWAGKSGAGLEIRDPERILKIWQSERPRHRDRPAEYFTLERPEELVGKIRPSALSLGKRAALTGLAAAARMAPMSRYLKTWILVEDLKAFADDLKLKRVDTGANLVLVEPVDEGSFYGIREVSGVPLACPVQIYLDLAAGGGRWEEASDALLEHVIKKEWINRTT